MTGTVEATYAASLTLSQRFGLLKERMSAMIGPAGNTVGALGSIGAAMAGLGPMLPKIAKGARDVDRDDGAGRVRSAAIVGLGVVLYKFRRVMGNVLSSVIGIMATWADKMLANAESAFGWIPGLGGKIKGARDKLAEFADSSAAWVDGWGEAEETMDAVVIAVDDTAASTGELSKETTKATAALDAAADSTAELSEQAKKASGAMADMKRDLLGLPTKDTREEFERLQAVWDGMDEDERAGASDRYKDALRRLRDAGAELNEVQTLMVDGAERHIVALKAVEPEIIRTVKALERIRPAAEQSESALSKLWGGFKAGLSDLKGNAGDILGGIANSLITGAGTMKEKLAGLGNKAADWLGLSMAAGLAAVPVVGPFLAQLGPSLAAGIKKIVGKVGGFFKRLFGGGDEAKAAAVAKALEIAQAATAAAIEAARAASQAVAQAVADAAVAAAEGTLAVATKMADAILAGITDAANAALADITELANAALAAATTAANAALQAVQDAATAMEGTLQGAIGAHDRAKDAGVQAYNEVTEAALEAGKSQVEATEAGLKAQKRAIAEVLKAEGEKYAQLAAFEVALDLVRRGRANEAEAAAIRAASQAMSAWTVALNAVKTADEIASGALENLGTGAASERIEAVFALNPEVLEAAQKLRDDTILAAQEQRDGVVAAATEQRDAVVALATEARDAFVEAFRVLRDEAVAAAEGVDALAAAISALPSDETDYRHYGQVLPKAEAGRTLAVLADRASMPIPARAGSAISAPGARPRGCTGARACSRRTPSSGSSRRRQVAAAAVRRS